MVFFVFLCKDLHIIVSYIMDNEVIDRIRKLRHAAIDMDGTIYCGKTLFDYTKKALDLLEKNGIGYTFLTNNSSIKADKYLEKLKCLGLKADKEHLYTSSMATIEYFQNNYSGCDRLFILGTDSLKEEFAEAGYKIVRNEEEPHLVVVGFDMSLTYEKLCKASYWIKNGKPFIATHPDFICPTDQPTVLVDCGAICAAITAATGNKPVKVLGKPDVSMLEGILKRHNLQPYEMAMIGDRIYTDMAMAERAGVLGVLVLSGEAKIEDAKKSGMEIPLIVKNIFEFAKLIEQSRS